MRKIISICAAVIVFTVGSALAGTPSFQGLGAGSGASGISSDGQVVVGGASNQAFRWTKTGGMVSLGAGYANGVSADGQVVVGRSGNVAFRWTSTGGMVSLGDLPGGPYPSSEAYGVSADGQVIIGESQSYSGREAFIWTSTGGMTGLGDLPGGSFESWATAVSGNGQVVVGQGWSSFAQEAFRWTNESGMVGLGDFPGGYNFSLATAVSNDGSVIVGRGSVDYDHPGASGTRPFRWTQETGMVVLGDLPGGDTWGMATAVSSDGSIIVGQGSSTSGQEAFIWDAVNGMRSLKDELINKYNLNLSGWQLLTASGISADGLTIVGYGANPSGNSEAWIATIPEPATLLLLGIGGLMLRKRK